MIRPCPICGTADVTPLTPPHPARAMVSDGRVLPQAMRKLSCNACGYGFHDEPPASEVLFGDDYDLGLRDTGADPTRARRYAGLVVELLTRWGLSAPSSLVEFGSGTGALLAELALRWPLARAVGLEPAAQLAAAARENVPSQVELRHGFAEALSGGERFGLCLSVNVLEHSPDPIAFFAACRRAVGQGGVVLAICPHADTPNSELLFVDHYSSFSERSLALAARRAGLHLMHSVALSGDHLGFRASLLRAEEGSIAAKAPELTQGRERYLSGWSRLEREVLAEVGAQEFSLFGAAEFADLLTAYAPNLVARAKSFVVDTPLRAERAGLPVVATSAHEPNDLLLAAVHPHNWRRLRSRLAALDMAMAHPYQFTDLRGELT